MSHVQLFLTESMNSPFTSVEVVVEEPPVQRDFAAIETPGSGSPFEDRISPVIGAERI